MSNNGHHLPLGAFSDTPSEFIQQFQSIQSVLSENERLKSQIAETGVALKNARRAIVKQQYQIAGLKLKLRKKSQIIKRLRRS